MSSFITLPGSRLNETEYHPDQSGSCNHHPSKDNQLEDLPLSSHSLLIPFPWKHRYNFCDENKKNIINFLYLSDQITFR